MRPLLLSGLDIGVPNTFPLYVHPDLPRGLWVEITTTALKQVMPGDPHDEDEYFVKRANNWLLCPRSMDRRLCGSPDAGRAGLSGMIPCDAELMAVVRRRRRVVMNVMCLCSYDLNSLNGHPARYQSHETSPDASEPGYWLEQEEMII